MQLLREQNVKLSEARSSIRMPGECTGNLTGQRVPQSIDQTAATEGYPAWNLDAKNCDDFRGSFQRMG